MEKKEDEKEKEAAKEKTRISKVMSMSEAKEKARKDRDTMAYLAREQKKASKAREVEARAIKRKWESVQLKADKLKLPNTKKGLVNIFERRWVEGIKERFKKVCDADFTYKPEMGGHSDSIVKLVEWRHPMYDDDEEEDSDEEEDEGDHNQQARIMSDKVLFGCAEAAFPDWIQVDVAAVKDSGKVYGTVKVTVDMRGGKRTKHH